MQSQAYSACCWQATLKHFESEISQTAKFIYDCAFQEIVSPNKKGTVVLICQPGLAVYSVK